MGFRTLPVSDAARLVAEGAQLVDVRQPEEFAHGSLPDAVNIPLGEVPDRLDEIDADRVIVLLCRSGNRSGQAATYLEAHGFGDVVNLEGGMLAVEP